jgi:hypothetical protein
MTRIDLATRPVAQPCDSQASDLTAPRAPGGATETHALAVREPSPSTERDLAKCLGAVASASTEQASAGSTYNWLSVRTAAPAALATRPVATPELQVAERDLLLAACTSRAVEAIPAAMLEDPTLLRDLLEVAPLALLKIPLAKLTPELVRLAEAGASFEELSTLATLAPALLDTQPEALAALLRRAPPLSVAMPGLQLSPEQALTLLRLGVVSAAACVPATALANEDFLSQAMATSASACDELREAIQAHPALAERAVELWPALASAFAEAPDAPWKHQRELALRIVAADPEAFALLGADLLADRAFVSEALKVGVDFASAAPKLRADRALALEAVRHAASNFEALPRALQADREIATAALATNPFAFLGLSAKLRADAEVALTALRAGFAFVDTGTGGDENAAADAGESAPSLEAVWQAIAPALRRNPDFERQAVEVCGAAVAFVDPKLCDKPLALEAVRGSSYAYGSLPAPLRADRDLLLSALRGGGGGVIDKAPPELLADPEVLKTLVECAPAETVHLPAELWEKPEVVAACAKYGASGCLFFAPESFRSNRELMLQVLTRDISGILALPAALRCDPDFMAQAIRLFPPLLDALDKLSPPAVTRSLMLRFHPELRELCAPIAAELSAFGIAFPERFHTLDALEQALANRRSAPATDGRPLAVLVYPSADENYAFAAIGIDNHLLRDYRLMYYEAHVDTDVPAMLLDATRAEKAGLFIVGGHGEADKLAFSHTHEAGDERWTDFLDVGDSAKLADPSLAAHLQAGAPITLLSCSTGAGRDKAANVANMVAAAFAGHPVYAPVLPTNAAFRFDEHGRFLEPGFTGGSQMTYCAQA